MIDDIAAYSGATVPDLHRIPRVGVTLAATMATGLAPVNQAPESFPATGPIKGPDRAKRS